MYLLSHVPRRPIHYVRQHDGYGGLVANENIRPQTRVTVVTLPDIRPNRTFADIRGPPKKDIRRVFPVDYITVPCDLQTYQQGHDTFYDVKGYRSRSSTGI